MEIRGRVETVQIIALLTSARILRRVLETKETCCHSNICVKPSANACVKNSQMSKTTIWYVQNIREIRKVYLENGISGINENKRKRKDKQILRSYQRAEKKPVSRVDWAVEYTDYLYRRVRLPQRVSWGPVGRGRRIHRLYLCRVVRLPQRVLRPSQL